MTEFVPPHDADRFHAEALAHLRQKFFWALGRKDGEARTALRDEVRRILGLAARSYSWGQVPDEFWWILVTPDYIIAQPTILQTVSWAVTQYCGEGGGFIAYTTKDGVPFVRGPSHFEAAVGLGKLIASGDSNG